MPESPISNAEKLAIIARIFDNTSDAMIVVNTDMVIVLVNDHAQFLFGKGSLEIEGQQVNILLPEDRREVHTHHLRGYINNPKPRAMGEALDLKAKRLDDDTEFTVTIELSPFTTAQNVYTLATIRRMD